MWKKFFIIACLWISFCHASFKYDLSVCTVFRNEAPYLKEWIEFHRLVGVKHFYLCSHNSQDNYYEVLEPYIQSGIVELKELQTDGDESVGNFNEHVQCPFFNACLQHSRGVSQWVAFIDTDEFLFPTNQGSSLLDILKNYPKCGGICVNWQLFGTSGVAKIEPHELMIESLTCCGPEDYQGQILDSISGNPLYTNKLVKSIVQPLLVDCFINPHFAIYRQGYCQTTTDYIPFNGPFSPFVQVNRLRINHYWTRDEEFFWERKVQRQENWWGTGAEDLLKMRDELNQTSDTTILRYIPELKKQLGFAN